MNLTLLGLSPNSRRAGFELLGMGGLVTGGSLGVGLVPGAGTVGLGLGVALSRKSWSIFTKLSDNASNWPTLAPTLAPSAGLEKSKLTLGKDL